MTLDAAPNSAAPEPISRSARIKKRLIWVALGLVLLVALAGLAAVFSIDWLAKRAIEYAGSRALGVATTLDRISIGIFAGNCSLTALQVANPPDFKSDYFIRLDQGALDMSVGNLMNDVVEIDQLTLSGIHVNLVRQTGRANFRTILDNIRQFETSSPESEKKLRKRFIIHEVVIRDIAVHIDLLPIGGELTQLDVPIPELYLSNVGSETARGENLARITAIVVRALLDSVIAKGQGILPPEIVADLTQKLSELKPLETLRALRDDLRERRQERVNSGQPLFPRLRKDRRQRRQSGD